MNIIPTPQTIDYSWKLKVSWRDFSQLTVSGLSAGTLELVRRDFPGALDTGATGVFCARLLKTGAKEFPTVEVPEKYDAYVMRISSEGIAIDANNQAGLWYGFQSLNQLVAGREEIPVCEIRDNAVMRRRGIHWDLKGYQPKFSVLMEEFRRLAQYKVNLVLLEIEDKYLFRNAPDVGCDGAYTFEQFRTLSRYAAALGITVVPKLQCLGHVDYLLKLPRYRHLREGEHPYQYCPRSDEVFVLWKTMAAELMECFSEHREFFHVGADETDKLGVCPECAKYSKADSYVFHVGRCLDFVMEKGRAPIMWEDILRDAHGELGPEEAELAWKLGRKAILNYWAYGYGGKRNTFPFLPTYNKQTARVWGASGFSGCDRWDGSLPPLEIRAKNIDSWTKTAIENDLEAVIATGWTRIASATPPTEPHETSWFTILYAAESMWSGKPRDCDEFISVLSQQLYGCSLPEPLRRAVLNINSSPFLFQYIDHGLDDNPPLALLQYAAATESFANSLNDLVASRRMFHDRLGNKMADYVVDGRCRVLQKFQKELIELEENTRKYLSEFYVSGTVDDYIQTRFAYCRQYAEDFLRQLNICKLL